MSNVLIPHGDLISSVYAELTAKFLGGEVVCHNHSRALRVNTDVVNWKREQLYESKAGYRSDRHMMRHTQIDDYLEASRMNFPLANPEVFYCFWEHDVSHVNGKSKDEMETALIGLTKSLLILSFDLVLRGKDIFGKASPRNWEPYTTLKASTRRGFSADPEFELCKLGVKSADYEVIRKQVKRKRFKQRVISPFDLMVLQPKSWRGLKLRC